MSQADLSLIGVAEDLLSLMWPAWMGLGGAEIVAVQSVLSATRPPRISVLMGGGVAVTVCCTAIAADVVLGLASLHPVEVGFSYGSLIWSDFAATMWPVVVACGLSHLALLLLSVLTHAGSYGVLRLSPHSLRAGSLPGGSI